MRQIYFDAETKTWGFDDRGERFIRFPAEKIRLLLLADGYSRQEITTAMARAKCVAYGITVWGSQ